MMKREEIWLVVGLIFILALILGYDYWDEYLSREAHSRQAAKQIRAEMTAKRAAEAEAKARRKEWVKAYRLRFENPERWEEVHQRSMSTPAAQRGAAIAAVYIELATNPSTAQEARWAEQPK
jgi:Flp pilus assembly protein TadB